MSEDRFLDGAVFARQSLTGFRAGLDAVMLAAAVLLIVVIALPNIRRKREEAFQEE